ncbi:MAG: glycosyltransferase [Bacteroidales bacterium]|nr:glycosyltransferase [Bacteroidales bacterium]
MAQLVPVLLKQAKEADVLIEIILIDDDSRPEYKKRNSQFSDRLQYIELKKNIGRAAIRNLFADYARYDHLLFLDCDSLIEVPYFLKNYADSIRENPEAVFCGGRIYGEKPSEQSKSLRWKYGTYRESKSFQLRNRNPYRSFMTNNFLIPKKVMISVHFDERLKDYGHEDTLFGYELMKNGIPVLHIDNPVLNGHLEDNATFLLHTEKAIANLVTILNFLENDRNFLQEVGLLRFYFRFRYLGWLIRLKFFLFQPLLKNLLERGRAGVLIFDVYKLGILAQQMK